MKNTQKKEPAPSFFKELGSFMRPYRGKYTCSVLISILGVLAGISAYGLAGAIAAKLFSAHIQLQSVLWLAAGAVACKIFQALAVNYSTWLSHQAAYGTLRDIRQALSRKFLKLPMGYFQEQGSGRLKTFLVDHVETMEKTLAHMLPELTANLLGPALCMIFMFFIDWRLALGVLLWIILGFSVTGGMMKDYQEKFSGQLKALKSMNQAISEYTGGIEVIKNFGRAHECYEKYRSSIHAHAAYNVNWMSENQKYSSLGMAIAPFSLFPVLLLGIFFFQKGSLSPSVLFLMVLLSFGIFGPLMNAMNYFDQLAAMGTHAEEIQNVLSYPELKRGSVGQVSAGEVSFQNVSFTYPGCQTPTVKNITLQVPAGTMLALTGPSGSGKSTIGKLLAGYWDPDEGQILLADRPLSQCTQNAINDYIAYVDQDTFLFDDTILNNIRLGCPTATDEQVMDCAKKAGCDEFIRALPQGYQTMSGTAGSRLSGGEKQRISIARAMMKNAPVLILDEATASSDPQNEASIQKALAAAAKGKTLIVIAHRLSTIRQAQQIAYIENGSITQTGTHQELLAHCPGYAKLWQLQEVK